MASDHPGTPANLEAMVQTVFPALEFKDFTPGELRKLIMDVYFTTPRIKQALTALAASGEVSHAGRYRFQLAPAAAGTPAPVTDAEMDLTLVVRTNAPAAAPQAAPAAAPQAAPAGAGRLGPLERFIMDVVCTKPGTPFLNREVTQTINDTHVTNFNEAIVLFTAKDGLAPKGLVAVFDPTLSQATITSIRCV